MVKGISMKIKYPEIGICGLSCRLCPRFHTETQSKCNGCKSESRMAGCYKSLMKGVRKAIIVLQLQFQRLKN